MSPATGEPLDLMFASDNASGASAAIVAAVTRAASQAHPAYGADSVTEAAHRRMSEVFQTSLDFHCVSTGTAANALSLATVVRPWGSILCHRDSHIQVDECGAPEFFSGGAKLTLLDGVDGKIDPDELRKAVGARAGDVHSSPPQVLSITQVTETGSVYTLDEMRELTTIAREAGLRVHLDGARFANAVVALDTTPAELSWRSGVDILSFGLTKNGGMTTEAIVCFDATLSGELAYRAKRAGQLASKMRFDTAQVDAYLTDDLWLTNARHANAMAERMRAGLATVSSARIVGEPRANLTFCALPTQVINGLTERGYKFHDQVGSGGIPEAGVVRLVTSHATTPAAVDGLVAAVADLGSPHPAT